MKSTETLQRVIGDDWDFVLDVRKNGVSVGDITAGGTITPVIYAALQDASGAEAIPATAQSDSLPDADWTQGIVAVEFERASTASLSAGFYTLELQIETGGRRRSWINLRVRAVPGVIP